MNRSEQLAYLGGLVDGEGSISMHRRDRTGHGGVGTYYGVFVRIGMTDRQPLEVFQAVFGGKILTSKPHWQIIKSGRKPMFYIRLNGEQAIRALVELLPYLTLKAEQAKLVILAHLDQHKDGFLERQEARFRLIKEMHN